MALEYTNPGDAFSQGLQNTLMKQEALKHQRLMDSLAVQEAHAKQQNELENRQYREKALVEHEADRKAAREQAVASEADRVKKEQAAEGDKAEADIKGRYGPGEYFAPEDIKKMVSIGRPLVGNRVPAEQRDIPATGALPGGQTMPASAAPAETMRTPEQLQNRGTFAQRDTMAKEAAAKAVADRLERDKTTPVPLITMDPSGGFKLAGNVDPRAKIEHLPVPRAPKDTSAADAARQDTRYDHAYTGAVKELDDWSKPLRSQLDAMNQLGTMINQRTPEADKLIAPLVIKGTISGQGSGFRMTRAEIENVVGGRSKWETLQATLNQWSLDPAQALSITDEQRTELRALAKAVREKANTQMQRVVKTRHALDDSTDAGEVHKQMTNLQEQLSSSDEEPDTSGDLLWDPISKSFSPHKKP